MVQKDYILHYFILDLEDYLHLFEDILINTPKKLKDRERINELLRRGTSPLRGEAIWLEYFIFNQILLLLNQYLIKLCEQALEINKESSELFTDIFLLLKTFLDCLKTNENFNNLDATAIFSQGDILARLESINKL